MAKVPPHLEQVAKEVKTIFSAVAKDMQLEKKELAFQIGVHAIDISNWSQGENVDRHMPAYMVPEICRVSRDFRLLDLLEHTAGRTEHLVFVPHLFPTLGNQDVKVVQALIKEVGEALQSLSNTLEDDIVEDHEYPDTIRELNDVIRECAKLKHWLKERLEADRQKTATPIRKDG